MSYFACDRSRSWHLFVLQAAVGICIFVSGAWWLPDRSWKSSWFFLAERRSREEPGLRGGGDAGLSAAGVEGVAAEKAAGPEASHPAAIDGASSRFVVPNIENSACDGKRWIYQNAYLFSMAPTVDDMLMSHFLSHYAAQGVDLPRHAHILLHVYNNDSKEAMLAVLRRFGVHHIAFADSYSSKLKREHVNKWLKSVPKDAWAIYPDSDEFFEFPCTLPDMISKGKHVFWGTMVDRLGPQLSFPELQTSPSISKQYPVACPGFRKQTGGDDYKQMLFKVRDGGLRQMDNSHTFVREVEKNKMMHLGNFPHYGMIGSSFLVKLNYKKNVYKTKNTHLKVYRKYDDLFDGTDSSGLPVLSQTGRDTLKVACKV